MINTHEQIAVEAIFSAARVAGESPSFDINSVELCPGNLSRGALPQLNIAWTAGYAWGLIICEQTPLGDYYKKWNRIKGTSMTPLGFPMSPVLAALLATVTAAAVKSADINLPGRVLHVARAV